MADLNSYLMSPFNQGGLLQARFPLKKNAQAGVCYALVIEFFRYLTRNPAATHAAITQHLTNSLGTSINRQAMLADGVVEAQRRGGGAYDFLELFNSMGRVSGIRFGVLGAGAGYGGFLTQIKAMGNQGGMLRIEFAEGGGHAIALLQGGQVVFDPNFGILASTSLERGLMTKCLWNRYATLGMTINKWFILNLISGQGVGLGNALAPA